MNKAESKIFNLTKGFPNVLLLGNGIITSLSNINKLSNKTWVNHIYSLSKDNFTDDDEIFKMVSYPLLTSVYSEIKDNKRWDSYLKEFKTVNFSEASLLEKFFDIKFDSILTTNYSYEIENFFNGKYDKLKNKRKYAFQTKKDSKYLLHTFNKFDRSPRIWHIHGELRRKSSIIATHDEYVRLVNKLVEENKKNSNKYIKFFTGLRYESWLDYFLMSNLYIVGLGMDFFELDLWWLLIRRIREVSKTGKVYYYEPLTCDDNHEKNKAKQQCLNELKVFYETLDVKISEENKEQDYITFYEKVADDIKNKIYDVKVV